jgi:uncharacterized protein YcfL
MKKYLFLALVATMCVACDKSELESAEETIIVMKEKEKDFKMFNDKLKGSKGEDVPQNQGQPKPTQQ